MNFFRFRNYKCIYKSHRNYYFYVISQTIYGQGEKLMGCLKIINLRNKVRVYVYPVSSSNKCSRP